jgi:hypothetical protein
MMYKIAVFNGLGFVVTKMTSRKAWHHLFLSQCLVAAILKRRSPRYVRKIRFRGMGALHKHKRNKRNRVAQNLKMSVTGGYLDDI